MSHYELIFVIDPIDETTEGALLDDDVNVLITGRLHRAFVEVDADGIEDAVRQGADVLYKHGAHPRRLHLDIVTKADIAERAEVSKPTVARWVSERSTVTRQFPEEHTYGPTGPMWAWGDVNSWLRRNSKEVFDGAHTLNRREVELANGYLRAYALERNISRVEREPWTTVKSSSFAWSQV